MKKRIKTVIVTDKPTLKEFLGDVVRMQVKYVTKQKPAQKKRRTIKYKAILHEGNTDQPLFIARGESPKVVLAKIVEALKANWPSKKCVEITMYVHLRGCSFTHSIPCEIGRKIILEAPDASGCKILYSC